MMYSFSQRSLERLKGVHPDLVKVMQASISDSPYDFGITEGFRSIERQRTLTAEGKSLTLNSRHLTGHAVDIAIFIDGKVTWDNKYYNEVAKHILAVAEKMGVSIVWGGTFRRLVDSVHFELNKKVYP